MPLLLVFTLEAQRIGLHAMREARPSDTKKHSALPLLHAQGDSHATAGCEYVFRESRFSFHPRVWWCEAQSTKLIGLDWRETNGIFHLGVREA